jgi:hypothetical protein
LDLEEGVFCSLLHDGIAYHPLRDANLSCGERVMFYDITSRDSLAAPTNTVHPPAENERGEESDKLYHAASFPACAFTSRTLDLLCH